MLARFDEARCHDEGFRVADGLAGAFFRSWVPGMLCAVKQDIGQDIRSMALAEARQGTDLGRFAQLLASAPAVPIIAAVQPCKKNVPASNMVICFLVIIV